LEQSEQEAAIRRVRERGKKRMKVEEVIGADWNKEMR
jgi:hypothetical protein